MRPRAAKLLDQPRRDGNVALGSCQHVLGYSAMPVNSSQEAGGKGGVWLRVRVLKSLVFSLSTTVRAFRDSLRVGPRRALEVCGSSAPFAQQ